jgi:hypothetical protein
MIMEGSKWGYAGFDGYARSRGYGSGMRTYHLWRWFHLHLGPQNTSLARLWSFSSSLLKLPPHFPFSYGLGLQSSWHRGREGFGRLKTKYVSASG